VSVLEVKGALHFEPGSRLAEIDGRSTATEEYHCSFGLNPIYAERLKSGLLKVAARDPLLRRSAQCLPDSAGSSGASYATRMRRAPHGK
jgi:hypothetical protein